MRRLILVLTACATALTTVSCGGSTAGTPRPTSNTSASASRLSPPLAQPPLDTSRFEADPCQALRPEQLTQFGKHSPPKAQEPVAGPNCAWAGADPTVDTRVTITINTRSGGLEGIYQRQDKFGHFQPTTVAGYPAVQAIDHRDAPKQGDCVTQVGVAEERLVTASVRISDRKHPDYSSACEVSDRAAALVVENLKGAK
ncbi:DUF3558 domain-containing protein [Streptoalloteichus hindustanus]|uniref:DUF3558 domain-containing protein n=1 Tax=Streptoalloteichus hindustanus TaxID=2017 RepID=A0A1M5ADN4_STRHI|nr:DUF3558 domain-containing protein [Streptoalloteichus hindustanus]SHF28343.1 Protein of unknown function [Streptoalloteichus hindustanus]